MLITNILHWVRDGSSTRVICKSVRAFSQSSVTQKISTSLGATIKSIHLQHEQFHPCPILRTLPANRSCWPIHPDRVCWPAEQWRCRSNMKSNKKVHSNGFYFQFLTGKITCNGLLNRPILYPRTGFHPIGKLKVHRDSANSTFSKIANSKAYI